MLGPLLKRLLGHPLDAAIRDVNDSATRIPAHRRLMEAKPLLREGYVQWYRELLPAYLETEGVPGEIVEIGCGPSFLDEFIPGLIKTDSVPNPFAHRTVDAMAMDFPDRSLRAIFVLGVVHHLPDPERFLREVDRCLATGGRVAMVEPSHRYPVAGFPSFLLRFLDHYEHRDGAVQGWTNPGALNMRGANLALPWVIFQRDRALFERRFPRLRLTRLRYHTAAHHFLAGGFALRFFVPKSAIPSVFAVERALSPVIHRLGAMMTIDLVKV